MELRWAVYYWILPVLQTIDEIYDRPYRPAHRGFINPLRVPTRTIEGATGHEA